MTPPVTTEALVEALAKTLWQQRYAFLQKATWEEALQKAEAIPDGCAANSVATVRSMAAEIVAKHVAPLLAAHQQITAERDEAREDRDDAIRMLDVWFDTSTKTSERVVPQLVDALVGYLRTCRCGGMPAETSDMIEAGAADFIRRRAGYIIAPVIEAMVAERTASLRAEGEAKDRALKDLRTEAAELAGTLCYVSANDDPKALRDLCWKAGHFLEKHVVGFEPLARAATAREGA